MRYNDTTINTNSSGTATFTQKWTSAGTRYYYATFAGDTWYKTFSSSAVTVDVQTDTQTIYYVPQAGSTWVNQGTAGASYNAYVSNPGSFQTQSNGYPYWGDDTSSDFVCIPAGSATNNQNVVSWEIGFHFSGVVAGQRYQKIWDKACGGFFFEIDTSLGANNSELTIYRATTGGSGARWSYRLIPYSAQATIITFKLRGTPARAQETNHIRRSGSVWMETRRCIKRTSTRAAALLAEPDHGATIQWVLRTWAIRVQTLLAKRQRRLTRSTAASLSTGNSVQSLILVTVETGTPINCAGPSACISGSAYDPGGEGVKRAVMRVRAQRNPRRDLQ